MKSIQIEHTNYSRKTKAQAQKYKNPHNKNTTKKSPYAQTKNESKHNQTKENNFRPWVKEK